jgi:hypothetical protein
MAQVTGHFRETRSRPLEDVEGAEEGSLFHLEPRITEQNEEEMEGFMLSEKNIADVIKSREDLSASGVDGISYRVMKRPGGEDVKFMKSIIRGSLRCGRVSSAWKEANTILVHEKGARDKIGN